jgi:DNA anti-recombination protein RmuC
MAMKSKVAKRAKKGSTTRKAPAKRASAKRATLSSKAAKKSSRGTAARRSTARKPAKAKKRAVKPTHTAHKSSSRRSKEVLGEGNYTAAREFRENQTNFVQRNKSRISKLGKQAEQALDGPEGDELRKAEEEGRSHAHE